MGHNHVVSGNPKSTGIPQVDGLSMGPRDLGCHKEHDDYDPNDIVILKSLTYYKLKFLTNDWILRTLYISKPQIFLQESITII